MSRHNAVLACAAAAVLGAPVSAQNADWGGLRFGLMTGATSIDLNLSGPGLDAPQSRGSSLAVGALVGHDWVFGNLVAGLEADMAAGDADDLITDGKTSDAADADWFATARGRVGYASGNTLVYGTAGLAMMGTTVDQRESFLGISSVVSSQRQTHRGTAFGLGVEYGLGASTVVGVEYRRFDFDRKETSAPDSLLVTDPDMDMVRLSLIRRF
jgi:outer membrane immunogenic protein